LNCDECSGNDPANCNPNLGNRSKCYDNDPANCNTYGRLYEWETAKKVCPNGWHLSGYNEWSELIRYVIKDSGCVYTCAPAKLLKAKSGWNGFEGIDAYGFSALPGGRGSLLNFGGARNYGYWWTATPYGNSGNMAYTILLDIGSGSELSIMDNYDSNFMLQSVRCVKDKEI